MIKHTQKIIALLTALVLLCAPVGAFHISDAEAAETLNTLGLLRGTDNGYELDRAITRQEAAVMLLRLSGYAEAAESCYLPCPFTDADEWAAPWLAYGYECGLIRGVGGGLFSARECASVRDVLTFALRAIGYAENRDFTWADALSFSEQIGLTDGEFTSADEPMLRADAVQIFCAALSLDIGGSRLIERLCLSGAVSREALTKTRLARFADTGRTAYTAAELYERCNSAVFFVEVFEDDAAWESETSSSTGSGFFISEDGIALLSWHELNGARRARITTTDGAQYEIESVIYYDTHRDIAVVRVSRTDTEGNTVRRFPYIPVGDTSSLSEGVDIFVIGNPLEIRSLITHGVVSGKSRELYGPEYPFLHISAAISSGSSGGPVLNAYGDAVALIYGTYAAGQQLNIAVPLECLDGIDLDGEGRSLAAVYDEIEAARLSATITAEVTELELTVGESAEVMIERDCPGIADIKYELGDTDVVSADWGYWETISRIPLRITAKDAGSTEVRVVYVDEDGNPDASAVIKVTVSVLCD